ncbi:uncharacterized protein BYT42DRAFT_557580, partial [Radiomyces spectabilis]|uniref:uncharacterized protein n=1 Tax=Radiomyces spectabilis TaxID=64574 RepID=UPI0022209911
MMDEGGLQVMTENMLQCCCKTRARPIRPLSYSSLNRFTKLLSLISPKRPIR